MIGMTGVQQTSDMTGDTMDIEKNIYECQESIRDYLEWNGPSALARVAGIAVADVYAWRTGRTRWSWEKIYRVYGAIKEAEKNENN